MLEGASLVDHLVTIGILALRRGLTRHIRITLTRAPQMTGEVKALVSPAIRTRT